MYVVLHSLRGNMSASLAHQLARKEGAIASAFTVLNYPRVPQELSAVACSILVHLLQTASDSRVPAEQLKQIAIPLMTGLSTTMSTSDVFSHLDSALQSLSIIPATIEEIRLAKKNGTLPAPMEKDCLEDAMDQANQESSANPETAVMGEKNDAELDHDLPMDELLKDAAQMHMRVYSQFASAQKLSLDALASFLSLLPETDEEGARPTPSQLLFRQLAVDFLVNDAAVKSARLDHICSLVALRLVSPAVFATGNAPVTSLSPERCAAICSSLTEANARQLGRVFDQTRAQAATALSSAMLFIPDEALPETLVRSLLPSVSNVLTSADVVALLHVSTPANPHPNHADSTLAVCRGDEIEALISTIHQLSMKPTFKLAADRAWAQRTPENIQQCAIVSPQTISAIATVAVSGSKNITSDIKSVAASTLGALGQSPALCEGAEMISNALLEMMLVCSRAKSTDADHDLIFEVLNAIIDMYSEDDRNVEVWKKLNMAQRLSTFVPIYSAAVRELRKSVKAKRPTPELMMRIDKAEDGLENLTQFVQYKKSLKL